MNQPEQGQPNPADSGSSSIDYAALHEAALELNHQTFAERANRETEPDFANDLKSAVDFS